MEFAEQLKNSVDIVTVIGEYVRLRKSGTRYTGLCPFHKEKTPSFSVNPQHQFFKCFGCNEGGDVIAFIEKHENLSFWEALKLLADRNGIPMPKQAGLADDETKARAAIYRMHEIAESEFRKHLASPAGAEARRYLAGRGVARDAIERFSIGYAPQSGVVRLLLKEFSPLEIEQSGLANKRDDGSLYDFFYNRLIFPIHGESGKTIAFGGRALSPDEQPKYKNSRESKIYRKSTVLYNMHRAKDAIRKLDRVILVEGYMDVIGVDAAGVNEVIASCGTALTSQQVQTLHRFSPNIVVNFDPDSAGANASERSIQLLLAEGMRVRMIALEDGLDPDEYCRTHGAEAYMQHVQNARGYFHWLADRARARFDMRTAEGRYAAFQFLLPGIQALGDKLERVAVVNDVAGYLGVDSGLVLENFRKMAADRRETMARPARETLRHADRILLSVLLSGAGMREEFFAYLKGLPSLKDSAAGKIYAALITLHESGEPVTYAALHARLQPPDQELLAGALLSADTQEEPPSVEEGMACLEALVEEERDRARSSLKAKVRQAERAGDMTEALRLYQELDRLQNRA